MIRLNIEEARYDSFGSHIVDWGNPIQLEFAPFPHEVIRTIRDGFNPDSTPELSKIITVANTEYRVSVDPESMGKTVAEAANACVAGARVCQSDPGVPADLQKRAGMKLYDACSLLRICYSDPIILRRLQFAYVGAPEKQLPWCNEHLPQIDLSEGYKGATADNSVDAEEVQF